MTVETTTRKQNFAGGQSALTYTFRARPSAPSDIKVDVTAGNTSSTLTYTTHYTVTVESDGIGGTVHVSPSYSTAYTYTVYRETTNKQESDYDDYNQFPADTLEASLDQTTMINQEQAEEIARSVKLPVSTTLSTLVMSAPSAGAVIGWDAAGTGLTNYLNADASVTLAANYATSAGTSANEASNYVTSASTQATLAGNYATTASTQATLAGNYATTASTAAASVPSFTRATFQGSDLSSGSSGTLTITHNLGLTDPFGLHIYVFDNNDELIWPDSIAGSTNTTIIDLTSYGAIAGTWGTVYLAG